ncbi:MAG TPA: metalloregulator ArsR/SmtB family transcription factor [Afifellaceae bacterium]|nr:metalloregulator ArsR/SmtB family transcription factor [Afifellaceae bacterium]
MTRSSLNEQAAADALAALGNRTRLRLFRLMVKAGHDGLNIGEIQARLDVPASTLAHHIATLTQAGLIEQERIGRETRCRAGYRRMQDLLDYLGDECCAGLDALADDAA